MGKAMLDLPDPLEKPATGAPNPASADDLLAQLAGEEIDRLLSEADARPEDLALVPEPETSAEAVLAAAREVDAKTPRAPASKAPAPPAAVSDIDLSQQLDDLFNQLVEAAPPTSEPAAATAAVVPPVAPEQATEAPAAVPLSTPARPPASAASPVPAELGTSIAERSALDLVSDQAEAASLNLNSADEQEPGPSIWLRPLEWLNAPLNFLPDLIREAMGKIALLTLFNAVAVLIYVFFFRKH